MLKTGVDDLHHFAETLEKLFKVMAKGGTFGKDKIRHFNGRLFEESTVFELTEVELRKLADAGLADWQFIQPGIMGTLFERALDFEDGGKLRAQLGAPIGDPGNDWLAAAPWYSRSPAVDWASWEEPPL